MLKSSMTLILSYLCCCCSGALSCLILCNPMDCSTPSFPVLHYLPELAQTHVYWIGDAIQPSHPLPSPSPLPSILPSIRIFSNRSIFLIRWPKYWSFNFSISISTSDGYSDIISFRIDWFDPLLVQGTLNSLLQHQNSKASVLQGSAFFMVQLSHLYMAAGKTIVLITQTFVGKMMSLLLNTLSRFVIAFLQGVSLF